MALDQALEGLIVSQLPERPLRSLLGNSDHIGEWYRIQASKLRDFFDPSSTWPQAIIGILRPFVGPPVVDGFEAVQRLLSVTAQRASIQLEPAKSSCRMGAPTLAKINSLFIIPPAWPPLK